MADVDILLPIRRPNSGWLKETLASLGAQRGVDARLVAVLHPDDAAFEPIIRATPLPVEVVVAPRQGGLSEALNEGLLVCDAKYVARIDADDIAEPDRFSMQLSLLESDEQCAVVGSNALLINEASQVIGSRLLPTSSEDILRMMRWKSAVMHPSTMLRAKVIGDIGGYSAEAAGVEDYDLWLRILITSTIRSIEKPLLRYRLHAKQITQASIIAPSAKATILASRMALASARGESRLAARLRHQVWQLRQQARSWNRMAEA